MPCHGGPAVPAHSACASYGVQGQSSQTRPPPPPRPQCGLGLGLVLDNINHHPQLGNCVMRLLATVVFLCVLQPAFVGEQQQQQRGVQLLLLHGT